VSTILGQGSAEHWAAHVLAGSFTAPDTDERLGLVGNIGDLDEIRWVMVGQPEAESNWEVLGVSEWLGSGFDAPPPFYLSPDLLDFDSDGQQELLNHYSRTQRGWKTSADILYRWNGDELDRIWRADTASDNTLADDQTVPQSYRENYQAEWELEDLDEDGLDEILLRGYVTFHSSNGSQGEDGVPILGEETWEQTFHWDGEAFRPHASDGPVDTFAYIVLGNLWLWQDQIARPLGVGYVREIRWSLDGQRLAWWASQPLELEDDDSRIVTLGVYDLTTDTQREFSLGLGSELSALHWTPDGRLIYTLLDQSPVLLDPDAGWIESFPVTSRGTWSSDGSRVAYERDGNLYVYDFGTSEEYPLVVAPEEAGAPKLVPSPVWSPRGDWIAYYLANKDSVWVGLVAPNLSEPLSGFGILETFDGYQATTVKFAWSPDGSRLAVLTNDPGLALQPTTLYMAELPLGVGQGIGLPDWSILLQLEATSEDTKLAWSPGGERVVLAVENEVWEVPISEEAVLRRRFSMPEIEWTTLEWSPNGRGYLVGVEWVYDEHLYWFPSDGADPSLLLAGSLGTVLWSPQSMDVSAGSGMALIEYTDGVPLFHFVGADGSESIVLAKGAEQYTPFHIGGDRVYYNKAYADRNGGVSLFVSDELAGCQPPLASPDARRLAWLCDDGVPDWSDLISGTAEINFRIMVTDDRGRNAREAWSHVEAGPDYRNVSLVSWRNDGRVIYLSRPKYGTAWAYFDYNPGIQALDLSTGEMTQIGDMQDVHDGRVSPDGTWLVQSKIVEWPDEGVFLSLRSLVDGTEKVINCAEGATVAGDFSFSPDNAWLAWREWATAPGGSMLLIRVLRLPNGEPLTVYGDAELTAPQIGGWLGRNDLVMVYPLQEDGTGGYSNVVVLPAIGAGDMLSPFAFVGTLNTSR
jgi:WD40 repeat protein